MPGGRCVATEPHLFDPRRVGPRSLQVWRRASACPRIKSEQEIWGGLRGGAFWCSAAIEVGGGAVKELARAEIARARAVAALFEGRSQRGEMILLRRADRFARLRANN